MKNPYTPPHRRTDHKNLLIAIVLAAMLVVSWQAFVEAPKRREMAKWQTIQAQKKTVEKTLEEEERKHDEVGSAPPSLPRPELLAQSPRISINSGELRGSIALKGMRFDDLQLARYRATEAPDSGNVILLSPQGDPDGYFIQSGWLGEGGVRTPDAQTLWEADHATLSPGHPVTLHWDNGQGLTFLATLSLDDHYMFTIDQRVENHGKETAALLPYAYINRAYAEVEKPLVIPEAAAGVLDGTLSEIRYKKLREEGPQRFDHSSGWLGIVDKYWLTALIPQSNDFKAEFSYYRSHGEDRYQAQYSAPAMQIASGQDGHTALRLFAGAKEMRVLDDYTQGTPPVPLFDRVVDYGVSPVVNFFAPYFLTTPMFKVLTYFYSKVGNFGIAIMLLTIVVKLLLFPLANKGYHAASQMRALQPQMQKLKESYGDDRVRMQQELAALYKREKVNPAAGCLPAFVQIPVFFALYKVFYVTVEMREAPFFGWLKDLSVADPSNIFTLFGLLPWPAPSSLQIGLLPILMCITMKAQMRMQPKPNDPTQARVMQFMPYFVCMAVAKMPAGLVLYYAWSNLLSCVQQWVITRRYNRKHPDRPAV